MLTSNESTRTRRREISVKTPTYPMAGVKPTPFGKASTVTTTARHAAAAAAKRRTSLDIFPREHPGKEKAEVRVRPRGEREINDRNFFC